MACQGADEKTFSDLGHAMTGRANGLHAVPIERKFLALFGVRPPVCAVIWTRLEVKRMGKAEPIHLLWALLLLKVYASEEVLTVITKVDRKTFRKWAWVLIDAISTLPMVCCFEKLCKS